jgi:hypothetical protein
MFNIYFAIPYSQRIHISNSQQIPIDISKTLRIDYGLRQCSV